MQRKIMPALSPSPLPWGHGSFSSLFSSISLCRYSKYNSVFSFLLFHMKGGLLSILFAPWFSPHFPLTIRLGDLPISTCADPHCFVQLPHVLLCGCVVCLVAHNPAWLLSDVWNLLSVPQPPWTTCTCRPPLPAATAVTQRAAWAPTRACTPSACRRPTAQPERCLGPPRPSPVPHFSQRLM